jgi:hypothetical protein
MLNIMNIFRNKYMSLSAIQVTTLRHNPVKNILIMNEVSTALEGKERPFPNITNRLITLNLNANRRFLIARWDDGSQEYLNPWQKIEYQKGGSYPPYVRYPVFYRD